MLLPVLPVLLPAAAAAPLSPALTTTPAGGFSISAHAGSGADHLRHRDCDPSITGSQCAALDRHNTLGGEIEYRPLSVFSLYGSFWHDQESIRAAQYAGQGWGAGGGVKLGVPLSDLSGVSGWIGYGSQRTASVLLADSHVARTLDLGAVLHGGSDYDGIVGWMGVGAAASFGDTIEAQDATLSLSMARAVPVDAIFGFQLFSDTFGGPWVERGRLSFGSSLLVGGHVSLTAWFSAVY